MRCPEEFIGLTVSMCCFLQGTALAQVRVSASPAPPVDALAIRDALRPVLSIASSADKNAPALIEQHLKTRLPKTNNDPRLHYVYALVLLKNFRHADATRAMQAAAEHPLYYFPVHHFLIYEQIRQKQYDEAIDSLVELSERIGEPSQLWTSEDDRLEAAHWLGRMIGFLEGPCGSSETARQMKQIEPALRMLTGPVYEMEINRGFDELHAEHREMQQLLLVAVETAGQKKAAELKAADEKLSGLDAQKKSIATSSREQAAIHKEQLREYESQLKAIETKYEALQATEATLSSAIASVRLEIIQLPIYAKAAILDPNFSNLGGQYTKALSDSELSAAMALKNLELQKYLVEYQANSTKQAETLAKAEQLMASGHQWQTASEKTEARTQAAVRGLNRWEQRLAKSKKNALRKSDQRGAVVQSRINLISSYDSLNVLEEIEDLEQSVTEAEVGL